MSDKDSQDKPRLSVENIDGLIQQEEDEVEMVNRPTVDQKIDSTRYNLADQSLM